MITRKSRRHGPIVLPGQSPRKTARPRPPRGLPADDALESPLPGELLVLLSRLHRSQPKMPGESDQG